MVDTSPARLLVTAEDELDFFIGDESLVAKSLHTVKTNDSGALVVHSASAVDFAVYLFT